MENVNRGGGRKWIAACLFLAAASPMADAADLEIVSTERVSQNGQVLLSPCVRNNSGETRQAKLRVGNQAIRWAYRPIPIPAKGTSCFTLVGSGSSDPAAYKIELE